MVGIRPLGYLHQSTVVCLSALQFLLRNKDVMNKEILLCYKKGNVLLDTQPSNEGVFLPLQYRDDHCLFYMILTACHELNSHLVAIQSRHRITLRDKDWCTTILWQECIFTIRLADKSTFLHLSFGIQRVSTLSNL